MAQTKKILTEVVDKFSSLPQVEAILLSGSRTGDDFDQHSDLDLYIYADKNIPVSGREEILAKYADYMEIDNKFWETEDVLLAKEMVDIVD